MCVFAVCKVHMKHRGHLIITNSPPEYHKSGMWFSAHTYTHTHIRCNRREGHKFSGFSFPMCACALHVYVWISRIICARYCVVHINVAVCVRFFVRIWCCWRRCKLDTGHLSRGSRRTVVQRDFRDANTPDLCACSRNAPKVVAAPPLPPSAIRNVFD